MNSFFTLHADLPREGPGDRASLERALKLANIAKDGCVLDAACGPGADIPLLLEYVPEGHVTALDKHGPFVEQVRAKFGDEHRLSIVQGNMASPTGSYDFIWCAGALYFLGIEAGLKAWRTALRPEGSIAFSELVWLSDQRPVEAVANCPDYPAMTDIEGVKKACVRAGYQVRDAQVLSDAGWECYYQPIEARIQKLREGDISPELQKVLNEEEAEITTWRKLRANFGYAIFLVEPA